MGYSSVWKVLDKMIEDFKRKGTEIPPNVIDDLKSAKTLLRNSKTEEIDVETLVKIARYLQNVEAKLISEAQEHFEEEYVDSWLKKLDRASREKPEQIIEKARFVSGVPRGEKWIRVKPSIELPTQKLAKLTEELRLSCTFQKDGYVIVHGKEDALKEFVKRMTSAQKNRAD